MNDYTTDDPLHTFDLETRNKSDFLTKCSRGIAANKYPRVRPGQQLTVAAASKADALYVCARYNERWCCSQVADGGTLKLSGLFEVEPGQFQCGLTMTSMNVEPL